MRTGKPQPQKGFNVKYEFRLSYLLPNPSLIRDMRYWNAVASLSKSHILCNKCILKLRQNYVVTYARVTPHFPSKFLIEFSDMFVSLDYSRIENFAILSRWIAAMRFDFFWARENIRMQRESEFTFRHPAPSILFFSYPLYLAKEPSRNHESQFGSFVTSYPCLT